MTSYNIFLIFVLLSWSVIFHWFPIKLKLVYHYPTHITNRVSNVTRFGPGEALMYFVMFYRCGAEEAREAHNLEDTWSKRVTGIITLRLVCRTRPSYAKWRQNTAPLFRYGAEGARRAHNPEVVGSNPTVGILSIRQLCRSWLSSWTLNAAFIAGIAQRKSA